MQVFSLPNLELLVCQELQDGLTFPWEWKPEQAALIRAAAFAQDGQLAMVSLHGPRLAGVNISLQICLCRLPARLATGVLWFTLAAQH